MAVLVVWVVDPDPAQRVTLREYATGSAAKVVSAVGRQSQNIEATTTIISSTVQHQPQDLDTGAQMTTWNGSYACIIPTTNLHPHQPPPYPPRQLQ